MLRALLSIAIAIQPVCPALCGLLSLSICAAPATAAETTEQADASATCRARCGGSTARQRSICGGNSCGAASCCDATCDSSKSGSTALPAPVDPDRPADRGSQRGPCGGCRDCSDCLCCAPEFPPGAPSSHGRVAGDRPFDTLLKIEQPADRSLFSFVAEYSNLPHNTHSPPTHSARQAALCIWLD